MNPHKRARAEKQGEKQSSILQYLLKDTKEVSGGLRSGVSTKKPKFCKPRSPDKDGQWNVVTRKGVAAQPAHVYQHRAAWTSVPRHATPNWDQAAPMYKDDAAQAYQHRPASGYRHQTPHCGDAVPDYRHLNIYEPRPPMDQALVAQSNQQLELREIIGDGNCLFRALCHQLEGHDQNHLLLRRDIVDFMYYHAPDFIMFVTGPFAKYLQEMCVSGRYGGQPEIVAFSRLYQCSVVIHNHAGPPIIIKGTARENERRLNLWYDSKLEHYSSLIVPLSITDDNEQWPSLAAPVDNQRTIPMQPTLTKSTVSKQVKGIVSNPKKENMTSTKKVVLRDAVEAEYKAPIPMQPTSTKSTVSKQVKRILPESSLLHRRVSNAKMAKMTNRSIGETICCGRKVCMCVKQRRAPSYMTTTVVKVGTLKFHSQVPDSKASRVTESSKPKPEIPAYRNIKFKSVNYDMPVKKRRRKNNYTETPGKSASKNVNVNVAHSDAVTQVRSLSDAVIHSDAVTQVRSLSDAVIHSDAVTHVRSQSLSDAVIHSDAATYVRSNALRSQSDALISSTTSVSLSEESPRAQGATAVNTLISTNRPYVDLHSYAAVGVPMVAILKQKPTPIAKTYENNLLRNHIQREEYVPHIDSLPINGGTDINCRDRYVIHSKDMLGKQPNRYLVASEIKSKRILHAAAEAPVEEVVRSVPISATSSNLYRMMSGDPTSQTQTTVLTERTKRNLKTLKTMLHNCLGAAQTIAYIEKRLYTDKLFGTYMYEKRIWKTGEMIPTKERFQMPLVSLERSLYTLASNSRMANGIFYCITLQCEGRIMTRYIEGGSYYGYMANYGAQRLKIEQPDKRQNLFRAFTIGDLTNPSIIASKDTPNPKKQYRQLLKNNQRSVRNQLEILELRLLDKRLKKKGSVELISLVVQCMSATSQRYTHIFPRSPDRLENWKTDFGKQLEAYTKPRVVRDPLVSELVNDHPPETVADQFRFISQIANDPYGNHLLRNGKMSEGHHSLCQSILFQPRDAPTFSFYEPVDPDEIPPAPMHQPGSRRNKLLYETLYPQVKKGPLFIDSLIVNMIKTSVTTKPDPERVPMHRERLFRPVLADAPDIITGCAPNMASAPSLYETYKVQMLVLGIVKFRTTTDHGCVLIMNSATDQGCVIPEKFEHIHIEYETPEDLITCSCSFFAFLQGSVEDTEQHANKLNIALSSRRTCFHATLINEMLLPYCKDVNLFNEDTGSDFLLRFSQSRHLSNSHCMIITNPIPRKAIKLSVKGLDDSPLAFVHISPDRTSVACQTGRCQGRMKASLGTKTREEEFEEQAQYGYRRKINKREPLTLGHWNRICPHLITLAQQEDVWKNYLSDQFIPEGDFNIEDANVPIEEADCEFDPVTKLWKNKALSQHKPHGSREIERLAPHVSHRETLTDAVLKVTRNQDHFLPGGELKSKPPKECQCGEGYGENDEVTYVADYSTNLYTRLAPLVCVVMKAVCKGGSCSCPFSGEEFGIFQLTKFTASVDELGWDFNFSSMSNSQSFTNFTNERTRLYRSSYPNSAPYMSPGTFIKWMFNWMAAQRIDFRITGDPCQDQPHCELMVVADGTHRGPLEKHLKGDEFTVINQPTIDIVKPRHHFRFSRVLLPYRSYTDTATRPLREHLLYLCERTYARNIQNNDCAQLDRDLLARCTDIRLRNIVNVIIDRTFDFSTLKPLAKLVGSMSRHVPLLSFLPWLSRHRFREIFQNVLSGIDVQASIQELHSQKPLFAEVLKLAANSTICKSIVVNFFFYLLDELERIHQNDPPYPPAQMIPDTYNPEKGIAYGFNKHGCKVREVTSYKADKNARSFESHVPDNCRKVYPRVGNGGFGYIMVFSCAKHHHIIGYHIINGGEGIKDIMHALYQYCDKPPKILFYDNSCHADEYGYNREPSYTRETMYLHDNFHGEKGHKCGWTYKAKQLKGTWHLNTSACEQFNAFILSIKYTASHLSLSHYGLFMQFSIHQFNLRKTETYNKKLAAAVSALATKNIQTDTPGYSAAVDKIIQDQYDNDGQATEEEANRGEAVPIDLDWGDNCDC